MGFFEPKWMNKNEAKARTYVEQLQDETKLLAAALDSPHETVCMTAARKLRTDDARLRVLKETKLRGTRRDQIIKEMIEQLQDKSRLQEYTSDPELIIRYFALKYTGQEEKAFEVLKTESDKGERFAVDCFADDLSVDEWCNLLVTTKCGPSFAAAVIEQLKKAIRSKEEFENILCAVAVQTEEEQVRTCASMELSIPRVIQRYHASMKAKELRQRSGEAVEETAQPARQVEVPKAEPRDRTQQFLKGEELSWDDKIDVMKNLTVEDVKRAGLTISIFERLHGSVSDAFLTDVMISVGETYAVKAIVDRYLIKWLNEKSKYNKQNVGPHTLAAARMLKTLYRNGICADKIKKYDGKVLQQAGKMPDFDMRDSEEREMAQGYHPDPEIRFDLSDEYGVKYIF